MAADAPGSTRAGGGVLSGLRGALLGLKATDASDKPVPRQPLPDDSGGETETETQTDSMRSPFAGRYRKRRLEVAAEAAAWTQLTVSISHPPHSAD